MKPPYQERLHALTKSVATEWHTAEEEKTKELWKLSNPKGASNRAKPISKSGLTVWGMMALAILSLSQWDLSRVEAEWEDEQISDNFNRALNHIREATASKLCYAIGYDFKEWIERPYNTSRFFGGWTVELEVDGSTYSDLDIIPGNSIEKSFPWVNVSELVATLNDNIEVTKRIVQYTMHEWECKWRE